MLRDSYEETPVNIYNHQIKWSLPHSAFRRDESVWPLLQLLAYECKQCRRNSKQDKGPYCKMFLYYGFLWKCLSLAWNITFFIVEDLVV